MLSCLWDGAYKRTLLLIGKSSPCDGSRFPLTIKVVLYHMLMLHNWYNKGSGMCCPVCGMVHVKDPLLLIEKSSGFPFSSLSGPLP